MMIFISWNTNCTFTSYYYCVCVSMLRAIRQTHSCYGKARVSLATIDEAWKNGKWRIFCVMVEASKAINRLYVAILYT